MTSKPPGKIITFYSYKGGTGRSMALANVAWILASQGKRVLTLDWDLEAPGLHRYFHPFLVDKELTSSDGLIDFVIKFAAAAATPELTEPATDGKQANEAIVYLAQTTPDLAESRQSVNNFLIHSGYTVLPDRELPSDRVEFDTAVRGYLKRATLSVHLINPQLAQKETYPFVYTESAFAAERDNEQGFSRLIWTPPGGPGPQPSSSEPFWADQLNPEAQRYVTLLQGPLDELFNVIRERVEKPQGDKDWYKPYANILRYASSLDWNFKVDDSKAGGSLDLIPAGRQGSSYSTRVNSFNWQNFYDRLGGGVLLEMAKERMRAEYDYVLIDSRTGVSDTSGICTVQMPDILVVCFTLNNQSIEGAGAVADSVHAQRNDVPIFPVPTRVEKFEKERLDLAREVAHDRFAPLLGHIEEAEKNKYWGGVEIFYEPFYAYEEMLAAFGDKPHQTNSLLASMERLTAYLTDNQVTQLQDVPESERKIVLAKYARQTKRREPTLRTASPEQKYWFYLSYSRNDDINVIEKFFSDLSNEIRIRLGLSQSEAIGFFDSKTLLLGGDWYEQMSQALENSRALVSLFSPSYFKSEWCQKEFRLFWDRMKAHGQLTPERPQSSILPVVWVPTREELPDPANRMSTFSPPGGVRRLMQSSSRSEEYGEFLDDLANALIDAVQKLPPLSSQDLPSFEAVRSASAETVTSSIAPSLPDPAQLEGGPRYVKFIYVVARPDELLLIRSNMSGYENDGRGWQPFLPASDERIEPKAIKVAAEAEVFYEVLPMDDDLLMRVRLAEQSNSPVVLIVDPWTTMLPQYLKSLQLFDRYSFINCAVVIVWNEQDEETKAMTEGLQQSLNTAFPLHLGSTPDNLWTQVRSMDELSRALSNSLKVIRSRILQGGQVMKRIEINAEVVRPRLSVASDAT